MVNFIKLLSVILAGFWFAGCAGTSSPSLPSPQGKPSSQSTQESSNATKTETGEATDASEGSKNGQAESQTVGKENQKQDKGQAESMQPAGGSAEMPDSQEARNKPEPSRPGSPETAGIEQPEYQKSTGSQGELSPETADAKLAEARKNLQVSEATEKRIAAELERLRNSGSASSETINNYEIYHESVQGIVAENRQMVAQMEAAKARHTVGDPSSDTTAGGEREDIRDSEMSGEQTSDEVAALDRQLSASLNQFDRKLLREMEDIHTASSERMRDLAQEAAEAAKRLRENGNYLNTSESISSEGSGETDIRTQQGRTSYEDDDIVARQLRQAAEDETDPELKEKLWKEYYEYKQNKR